MIICRDCIGTLEKKHNNLHIKKAMSTRECEECKQERKCYDVRFSYGFKGVIEEVKH